MTAHARARIGWFMWTFPRLSAAVAEYAVRWRGWRDQRRAADGSPFWGDTGSIGDLATDVPGPGGARRWAGTEPTMAVMPAAAGRRPAVSAGDDLSGSRRDQEPEPQVIDRDAASSAVHHWAKVAHDEIGAQYVPGRVPIPAPARPGTPSVAAPGYGTGSDAATVPAPPTLAAGTRPEAASSGGLQPPPAPGLPGQAHGPACAGEPHLPPPGTGDGRDRAAADIIPPRIAAALARSAPGETVIDRDHRSLTRWLEAVTGGDPFDGRGSADKYVDWLFAGLRPRAS